MTPELPTSDPPAATLALPAGPLAYVDEGPKDAPALLAIHGIPGSARDFRYLAPHLAEKVRVIRVDLPGFGGSAPADDAIDSLSGRARVLRALADHLGLGEFAVLGHSMGGGTALALAAEHPRRVRLLILVASVALSLHRGLGLSPRTFRLLSRSLSVPGLGRVLAASVRGQYRKRGFSGVGEMSAADFALHFRYCAAVDFDLLRRWVKGPLPPTLVAYARDDRMLETWISEELASALPHARVLAFDEGGHNLQKTRAAELAGAIRECLGL